MAILKFVKSYALFYVYMFPTASLNYYMSIFEIDGNNNMEISNMSNIPNNKANKYKIISSS